MANRGHVEAGGNNLAIAPGDHLADLLGTLVHEQNKEGCLRMVDRHAFDDRLKKHRFAGAGGGNDESALAVPDRRDEIDCSACQLGSALGGPAGFELELALRIGRDERSEIGAPCRFLRTGAVDLLDVDDDHAIAMIMPGGREHLVAPSQHVLPHDIRGHVRIARLGEIAVRRPADEPALALRIEPPRGLPIGNDGSHWCARALLGTRRIRLLLSLSSASTLVAAAASVVTMFALSGMALLIAIALLAAPNRLRIVLLLRSSATRRARSIRGRSDGRKP